jgi:fructose-bisphosphate aldolase, class II
VGGLHALIKVQAPTYELPPPKLFQHIHATNGPSSEIVSQSQKNTISTMSLPNNRTLNILTAAEHGNYAVPSPVIYNLSHIIGSIKAAESKHAPLILEMFPWAVTWSNGLLVHAAAQAARQSSVPVAVHLDHAQDEAMIKHCADNLPFDSIMVDMSHYEREENLRRTKELTAYCHARGIAVEAEPGRIEGGEDGIASTEELESIKTTIEDVESFAAAGVDILAPAIGNIHGPYGPNGANLDLDRQVYPQRHVF